MNNIEIKKQLKSVAGFFEVYHITTFKGYRDRADGATQAVTIEILDSGEEAGDSRYACVATSEDGKTTTGNNAPTIDWAIGCVHWDALDR
jgi:hypothetical protein